MPEVEFRIDPATGKLTMQVRGVAGPACENVARLVKHFIGKPAVERTTEEYYSRPTIRPQVRPKRS